MTGQGLSIRHGGRVTMLKWHRARKMGSDGAFTGARIVEGLQAGASVEVDLNAHAGGGFAVLHDMTLDRETTGQGPVAAAGPDALRQLHLRDNAGAVTDEPLMLLGDLCARITRRDVHPDALLQLDLKTGDADLTQADVAAFARHVGPLARSIILSSDDATAVARLAAVCPGLRTGHDPCHDDSMRGLLTGPDFLSFAADALDAAPRAAVIYLDIALVMAADRAGADLIGVFRSAGRQIDAYTVPLAENAALPVLRRLLALGVDQITTDDPVGLERLLLDAGVR